MDDLVGQEHLWQEPKATFHAAMCRDGHRAVTILLDKIKIIDDGSSWRGFVKDQRHMVRLGGLTACAEMLVLDAVSENAVIDTEGSGLHLGFDDQYRAIDSVPQVDRLPVQEGANIS